MERYSIITEKFPREFVLLQGTGCRWGNCTFCDYHSDRSSNPFELNKLVLDKVSGCYGVLDVINSGSCTELDSQTIAYIQQRIKECSIHTLWFEAHWMYRKQLDNFAALFPGVTVKFRCGVETLILNCALNGIKAFLLKFRQLILQSIFKVCAFYVEQKESALSILQRILIQPAIILNI